MVLITPYRPSAGPPVQVQPTNVSGSVGAVETTPVDATVTTSGGRQTVLDGSNGFPSTWATDYAPWDNLRHENDGSGKDSPSEVYTTLNGANAVTLTWPEGALPSNRWGGWKTLPSTYEEAWLTFDVRFEANWVTGRADNTGTQKLWSMSHTEVVAACEPITCPSSIWGARLSTTGSPDSDVQMLNYMYYPEKVKNCGDNFLFDTTFPRETVLTVEHHIKLNSSANTFDGLVETKINGTKVSTVPGLRLYCGTENERAAARVGKFYTGLMIYGGSGTGWEPSQDSSITFGAFKVEVPA